MTISYRGKIELPPIRIGDGEIHFSDTVKFLGIYIDHNLNFSHHIKYITNKIAKNIGILYKLRHYLPHTVLITLYQCLIQPYLLYGLESWYGTSQQNINSQFVLQKKAVRAINMLPYTAHTTQYFYANKVLKLEDLHRYHTSIYMYKTLHSGGDNNLLEHLQQHSDLHTYQTRGRNNLVIPKFNRAHSQSHLSYVCAKLWNDLPDHITECNSIYTFKRNLKNYLFSLYN